MSGSVSASHHRSEIPMAKRQGGTRGLCPRCARWFLVRQDGRLRDHLAYEPRRWS